MSDKNNIYNILKTLNSLELKKENIEKVTFSKKKKSLLESKMEEVEFVDKQSKPISDKDVSDAYKEAHKAHASGHPNRYQLDDYARSLALQHAQQQSIKAHGRGFDPVTGYLLKKQTKEEVEELNELSKDTLKSYQSNVQSDIVKQQNKGKDKKLLSRQIGLGKASQKIALGKHTTEEVELYEAGGYDLNNHPQSKDYGTGKEKNTLQVFDVTSLEDSNTKGTGTAYMYDEGENETKVNIKFEIDHYDRYINVDIWEITDEQGRKIDPDSIDFNEDTLIEKIYEFHREQNESVELDHINKKVTAENMTNHLSVTDPEEYERRVEQVMDEYGVDHSDAEGIVDAQLRKEDGKINEAIDEQEVNAFAHSLVRKIEQLDSDALVYYMKKIPDGAEKLFSIVRDEAEEILDFYQGEGIGTSDMTGFAKGILRSEIYPVLRNKEVNEATTSYIDQIRDIVDNKQAKRIKFSDGSTLVDGFTASAIIQLYDNVNDQNKEKIASNLTSIAGVKKIASVAFKLLKESTGVTDYNPKSQGGTRKQLLARLKKTKDSKDATAARKAGATQKELKDAMSESKKAKSLKENFNKHIVENDMSDESYELVLFGENHADLYRQRTVPIMKNLTKKWDKGVYDHELAVKLWTYWASDAAQRYSAEHGSPDIKWNIMFPPSVRKEAAEYMANSWEEELKIGNRMESTELNEKVKNPYAIGMAQAMKSTGDKPPLEKSTIKKAHKIAKKVNEGRRFRELPPDDPESFANYILEFYGPDGIYPMGATRDQVLKAIEIYLSQPETDMAYDSIDRENVRDILISKFGLKIPDVPRRLEESTTINRMINESYSDLFFDDIDTGEYDARKTTPSSKEKGDEVFANFKKRSEEERKSYEQDLKDRQSDVDDNSTDDDNLEENVMNDELSEMMRLAGVKTTESRIDVDTIKSAQKHSAENPSKKDSESDKNIDKPYGYRDGSGKSDDEKELGEGSMDLNLLKAAQKHSEENPPKKDAESDRNINKPYGYRDSQSKDDEELDEAEMEEGNNFIKSRLDAIKNGKSSFEVDGKTYKVTGDTSDESKNSNDDLKEMMRLAGMKLDECGDMGASMMSPVGSSTEQQGRMNVSTNMSSDGTKSVTVTADGDAAVSLMQILTLAGMKNQDSQVYSDETQQMEKVEEVMGNSPDPEVMPVQVLTKGGDGEVAGKEKKMSDNGSARFSDNPLRESSDVKVVHNKVLGGWYIVRGKHQTPIGGRFDSKEQALAHLNRKKDNSLRESDVKLDIAGTEGKSDEERHAAIMNKYPNAKKVGKTPGAYSTTGKGKADLVSGIRGVRKITTESDGMFSGRFLKEYESIKAKTK